MTRQLLAAASATALLAGPAAAQLTAEGLWADWQATASSFGTTLDAESATYEGGALVLEGLRFSTEAAGSTSEATLETMTLTEMDDGSVVVTMPDRVAMTSTFEVDGETVSQGGELVTDGFETVVTEEGGARRYDTVAAAYTQVMDLPADPEADMPAMRQTISLTGLESVTVLSDGAFEGGGGADQMTIDMRSTEDDTFSLVYVAQGVGIEADGTFPAEPDTDDVAALMREVDFGMGMGSEGSTFKIVSRAPDAAFAASGAVGASEMGLGFGPEGLSYGGEALDVRMDVRPDGIPVAFAGSLGRYATALAVPTFASPEAQDYEVTVALEDLELSEMIWQMVDPGGALPREPATLIASMTGQMRVTQDVFSEEAAEAPLPPFEPQTLTIAELLVSAAGAELTGGGSLDFPVLFPVPEPVGTIELSLSGGFALMDGLVAMGVVPPEQAAFIRGMAGAVARPVGDDMLQSTIEFTEGGGIVANGLPLK